MRQASAEEVEQLLEDALRSVDAGRYRIDPEPLHHDPRDVLRLRIILLQTYDDPARGGGPAVPLAMGGLGAGIAAWAFVHVQCASVALVVALLWVVLFLFEAGFEHQMLWWRSEPENPEHRNLVCLFDLLGEEDIDERLLKAEVGRRLGRFDEALRLASLVGLEQASVGLMTLAVCIRNLAEKQRRKLSSLGWPEFEMIGRPGPQRVEAQRYGEPPSRPRSSQQ